MLSLRYLLLGIPSGGLLGPVAVAWTLGRLTWRRALVLTALALPLWALPIWQPYLWATLLWLVGLTALNAWAGGGLREGRHWLLGAGAVLGHLLLALGLILLFLVWFLSEQGHFVWPREWILGIGAALTPSGLLLLDNAYDLAGKLYLLDGTAVLEGRVHVAGVLGVQGSPWFAGAVTSGSCPALGVDGSCVGRGSGPGCDRPADLKPEPHRLDAQPGPEQRLEAASAPKI
ncbi:DUF4900 domain-containing protein [Calidithermus timidus]|jgi:hypothetical protein|uniref:DUF4900 domain-containing protein n=1 Tax=Calidithermus timidus TaxID=307124 RepID=UPI000366AA78|nr:DUF4900 domain-containing protein [Calidithermus timidus]